MPATTPSRNSPATWWRRRRTCAAASTPCRPRAEGEPALVTKLREGFEGVERSFLSLLERNGIVRKDAVRASPSTRSCTRRCPSSRRRDGVAPGTVIQAWTPAWTLNGRLLKPAMVVVAAGGA